MCEMCRCEFTCYIYSEEKEKRVGFSLWKGIGDGCRIGLGLGGYGLTRWGSKCQRPAEPVLLVEGH